jgi:hypothetical protein
MPRPRGRPQGFRPFDVAKATAESWNRGRLCKVSTSGFGGFSGRRPRTRSCSPPQEHPASASSSRRLRSAALLAAYGAGDTDATATTDAAATTNAPSPTSPDTSAGPTTTEAPTTTATPCRPACRGRRRPPQGAGNRRSAWYTRNITARPNDVVELVATRTERHRCVPASPRSARATSRLAGGHRLALHDAARLVTGYIVRLRWA